MKENCTHENFIVEHRVNRLHDENSEEIKDFALDIKIHCKDCLHPFEFLGMQAGLSFSKPMCCPDGLEARLPIKPI